MGERDGWIMPYGYAVYASWSLVFPLRIYLRRLSFAFGFYVHGTNILLFLFGSKHSKPDLYGLASGDPFRLDMLPLRRAARRVG